MYLGIAGIVALLAIITLGMGLAPSAPLPLATPDASSTLAVVETEHIPAEPAREEPPAISTKAPSVESPPAPKPATKKSAPTPSAPVTKLAPPPQPSQHEFDTTAARLKEALVNILCSSGDPRIRPTTGTGVLISDKGYILTNAHLAQYFLLAGDPSSGVSCVLRIGSPAHDRYRARAAFVSPSWIRENVSVLRSSNPTGTGENDFAILAIVGSVTNEPLPSAHPFIPLATQEPHTKEPVVIGSYGAQFINSIEIQTALYPTLAFANIKEVFTFASSTIDVLTIEGSVAAQKGSSGGGLARVPGALVGIITTSTVEGSTAERTLASITLPYIAREYARETGHTLATLLSRSPIEAVAEFAQEGVTLRTLIQDDLRNNP